MSLFLLLSLWIFLCQATPLTDSNCTGVECEGPSLSCPSDSRLLDGKCSCDPSLCKLAPVCYEHQQLVLSRVGTRLPGDCCDTHECADKPGTNCSQVVCPPEPTQCPPDSYQLPISWHPGDCCGKNLGCQCLPTCGRPSCLAQEVARVVRVGTGTPGSCCPIYECISKDVNEACETGTSWLSADCEDCKCERGIKFCSKVECPKLRDSCTLTEKPKGQCCPVCLEESTPTDVEPTTSPGLNDEFSSCLLENGTLLHVGETYFADSCTNCTCQHGGRKHCTASMCEVTCVNPQYRAGECCPVCDGSVPLYVLPHCSPLVNCRLRCKRGFVTTDNGCIACQCQDEECILDCKDGYLKDTNGNDLCECAPPPLISTPLSTCPPLQCSKKCAHGLKRKDGCDICKCAQCPSMNQCEKQCANGYARDENGCHMCRCKAASSRSGGDSNSPCYTEDGKWRDNTEVWRDGCRECHCIQGREMCTLIACPSLVCEHPTPANSTQCCPHCPDTPTLGHGAAVCMDFQGDLKLEGQSWTLNSCTDCTCRTGKVLCYSQQCPPVACSNPVQPEVGSCCLQCAAESEEITAIVVSEEKDNEDCGSQKNSSTWREGPCISCRCERGHRICYQQECAALALCVRAVVPKHSCCPVCLDTLLPKLKQPGSRGCQVNNMTYQENQEWQVDDCTSCVCKDGNHHCTQGVCAVTCSKPVVIPNQCCPLCLDATTTNDSAESVTNRQIRESLYILLIVLFCISTLFAVYACRQIRLRRHRLHLQEYGCPPPTYQYKYIPTSYETQRPLAVTSEEKEKLALAPV